MNKEYIIVQILIIIIPVLYFLVRMYETKKEKSVSEEYPKKGFDIFNGRLVYTNEKGFRRPCTCLENSLKEENDKLKKEIKKLI